MKALSIRQPWVSAILELDKRVENRTWDTRVRGTVLLHAGSSWNSYRAGAQEEIARIVRHKVPELDRDKVLYGGIVGVVELYDVIEPGDNPPKDIVKWWNPDEYGFLLRRVKAIPIIPCPGKLGFWDVPDYVAAKLPKGIR